MHAYFQIWSEADDEGARLLERATSVASLETSHWSTPQAWSGATDQITYRCSGSQSRCACPALPRVVPCKAHPLRCTAIRWIYPHAQSNRIDVGIVKLLEKVGPHTCCVAKYVAAGFLLIDSAYIGTSRKRGRLCHRHFGVQRKQPGQSLRNLHRAIPQVNVSIHHCSAAHAWQSISAHPYR